MYIFMEIAFWTTQRHKFAFAYEQKYNNYDNISLWTEFPTFDEILFDLFLRFIASLQKYFGDILVW